MLADFQTKSDGSWKKENEDGNVYLLACCCWNGRLDKRVWTVQRLQDNYTVTYICHFDRTMDVTFMRNILPINYIVIVIKKYPVVIPKYIEESSNRSFLL